MSSEAILHPLFKEFERLDEQSGVSWRSWETLGNRVVSFCVRSQNFSEEKAARASEFFRQVRIDDAEFRMKTAQGLAKDDGWFEFAGISTPKFRELHDSMVLNLVIFVDDFPPPSPKCFFFLVTRVRFSSISRSMGTSTTKVISSTLISSKE